MASFKKKLHESIACLMVHTLSCFVDNPNLAWHQNHMAGAAAAMFFD